MLQSSVCVPLLIARPGPVDVTRYACLPCCLPICMACICVSVCWCGRLIDCCHQLSRGTHSDITVVMTGSSSCCSAPILTSVPTSRQLLLTQSVPSLLEGSRQGAYR
jgi:hypothetical protein